MHAAGSLSQRTLDAKAKGFGFGRESNGRGEKLKCGFCF